MAAPTYTQVQLRALSRELVRFGFFFYQLEFVWGGTPGIRNRSGSLFYFLDHDEIRTPRSMYEKLVDRWRPVSTSEILFYNNRLASHFASFPQDIPDWANSAVLTALQPDERSMALTR